MKISMENQQQKRYDNNKNGTGIDVELQQKWYPILTIRMKL